MKKRELSDIRKSTIKELKEKVFKLKKDALERSVKISSGEEKNLKSKKALALDIAQIMTIISEKQRQKESEKKKGEK